MVRLKLTKAGGNRHLLAQSPEILTDCSQVFLDGAVRDVTALSFKKVSPLNGYNLCGRLGHGRERKPDCESAAKPEESSL